MRPGQVVLFEFPNTDLIKGKLRPALLITPVPDAYPDWLICMISSKLHHLADLDSIIKETDTDFSSSGLKVESIVRVTRLAVVSENIFIGSLGEVSESRLKSIKEKISAWILPPSSPESSKSELDTKLGEAIRYAEKNPPKETKLK